MLSLWLGWVPMFIIHFILKQPQAQLFELRVEELMYTRRYFHDIYKFVSISRRHNGSEYLHFPWWRHQMETFSALLYLTALCEVTHKGLSDARSPADFLHKGRWHVALMLICAWTNGWANNRHAGDLRRHRTLYYVTVMPNWRTEKQATRASLHLTMLMFTNQRHIWNEEFQSIVLHTCQENKDDLSVKISHIIA